MTAFRDEGFDMVGETPNSGYVAFSINQGITLVGSNQATGTVLSANVNVVNAGSTCVLPANVPAGALVIVINEGAAVVTPYPSGINTIDNRATSAAGGTIAALASNVPGIGKFMSLGTGSFVLD